MLNFATLLILMVISCWCCFDVNSPVTLRSGFENLACLVDELIHGGFGVFMMAKLSTVKSIWNLFRFVVVYFFLFKTLLYIYLGFYNNLLSIMFTVIFRLNVKIRRKSTREQGHQLWCGVYMATHGGTLCKVL